MFAASKTAGAVSAEVNYIEDVFSTYLYTGDGTTKTITNGIDLASKGGLVWIKIRNDISDHVLTDSARGVSYRLASNSTAAQTNASSQFYITSFNSNGFTEAGAFAVGQGEMASWTFRKQPKFFDVVTYTGNGSASRTVTHNLGSVPGCIIVKKTSLGGTDWSVYHRSLGNNALIYLDLPDPVFTPNTEWATTTPTSTAFYVNGVSGDSNTNGATYVAYLFAHDAGGFGLTGTDNVISCGSYTGNGSATGPVVTLGYEPQWLIIKSSSLNEDWTMVDTMRGFTVNTVGSSTIQLLPNNTADEGAYWYARPTATGFQILDTNTQVNGSGATYIYVAIRRGPMKVPTSGTSVFGLNARTGTGANATVTGGQTDDAVLIKNRGSAVASLFSSRLTGTGYMVTSTQAAEVAAGTTILQANPWDVMDGVKVGTTSTITNASANTYINYLFKRAPSFMDVVCYTGTGTAGQTFNHNLGVVPEMMIVKHRTSGIQNWRVYHSFLGATKILNLNSNASSATLTTIWNDTAPTSTVFSVGTSSSTNDTSPFINYLFATCSGVSKVGSYTGNGTTQTIDCGLTAGARFVLIKRTDASGNWYVYDTARGMTVLTDPYWLTDSSAAEVATLGSVTTVATGFAVDSTILAAINVNAGTYIFLAIA